MQSSMGDIEFSGYDHAGRLTTLIRLTAALAPISTLISSFDATGNRIGEVRDGVMSTYLYDQRNRLLVQQKPGQYATFAYSPVDSVLLKWYQGNPPLTMTFDAASRQISSNYGAASTGFVFDGAGNRTSQNEAGAITGFYYDPENRLRKTQYADGSLGTYAYLGYSRMRFSNQEPGTAIFTTVWDDQANYLGEVQ